MMNTLATTDTTIDVSIWGGVYGWKSDFGTCCLVW